MSVSVGILGFAHGHVNAYCKQWRERPELDIDVIGGWDHDRSRLEKAASDHGISAHTEVNTLFSEVDAVVIGAETSLHADLVEQAAEAGKVIVLQKPMALTMSEADRIVEAVNSHGVAFTMAWQMRVDPQNIEIKRLVDEGVLGNVFMVRRRHGLSTHRWPGFSKSWHVSPTYNRDIWADDAAHAVDFLFWLLGVPQSVTAEIESLHDPKVPMDNGIALFRYAGGPLAEVCSSFTCAAGENTTEVICERGTVIQNYGDAPSCNIPRLGDSPGLKWYDADQEKWHVSEHPSPPNHGHRIAYLSEPLAEFLHGRRGPIASAEEGRTALRMVLATYVSAKEGRRVQLDDPKIDQV